MSDFLWSRLALSGGIQSLERLALLMALLMLGATILSCWRSWTHVTPGVRWWAPLPARLERASEPYGARQLIRIYPSAMKLGVGSAGALHVGLALLSLLFLANVKPEVVEQPPITIICDWGQPGIPTVPEFQASRPARLSLPDPRNAIPTPLDRHLALMDSSDMALAGIASQFGTPFGEGLDTEGSLDGRDGPLGSRSGPGFGLHSPDVPDPDAFIAVDQLPELVWMMEPAYPEMARLGGVEGVVELLVLVSRDGSARLTRIAKSIPGLDESAVAAATTARFKPALFQGKPVAVWVAMPIRFRLN